MMENYPVAHNVDTCNCKLCVSYRIEYYDNCIVCGELKHEDDLHKTSNDETICIDCGHWCWSDEHWLNECINIEDCSDCKSDWDELSKKEQNELVKK